MTYHYGLESRQKLKLADRRIVRVFEELIEHQDTTIIETARTDELQKLYFAQGRSKLDGITRRSKHQVSEEQPLALAVDAAPYYADEYPRIPWRTSPIVAGADCTEEQARRNLENLKRWHLFAGRVLGIAESLGVRLRWGGDWDTDHRFNDQLFDDLPHFELVE